MIEEHLRALKRPGSGFSKATAQSAEAWLSQFRSFCGNRSPWELRSKDLEAWHKELSWTPGPSGKLYSQSSINQAVGAVRRLYRWGLAEGLIETNPTSTLFTPKAQTIRSNSLVLSLTDARKLLASPSLEEPLGIRDRAIFGILLETGVSHPACAALDLSHLQLDTGALQTKGRQTKIHSLSLGALADLERYLREARPLLFQVATQALFLDSRGNRITSASIHQALRRHRHLAGL